MMRRVLRTTSFIEHQGRFRDHRVGCLTIDDRKDSAIRGRSCGAAAPPARSLALRTRRTYPRLSWKWREMRSTPSAWEGGEEKDGRTEGRNAGEGVKSASEGVIDLSE